MSVESVTDSVFPWDKIVPYRALAERSAKEQGVDFIDATIGSPVDDVPISVQNAISAAANTPSYPTTAGTSELRDAIVQFLRDARGIQGLDDSNVLPTIGSKEAVGLLPLMLGLGAGDVVVRPSIAYPTYDIGTMLVGATALATDDVDEWAGNTNVKLVWIDYPNNPTGEVADAAKLRRIVQEARAIGAVVASDECYAMFNWGHDASATLKPHISILDEAVCDGDFSNLLMLYSLSKQANLAGYRAAFIAGDNQLIKRLLAIRKQVGLIVPHPIQAAFTAALLDTEATNGILKVYKERHFLLREALLSAGYEIEHSEAGLYFWVRAKSGDSWTDIEHLAKMGILVGPGEFYNENATNYLRFSITITTEQVLELSERLRRYSH
jgi:succinyldiaminopimelate transaminase